MPSIAENIESVEGQIETLMAEAQAIMDGAAEREGGALLADEQARVDEILGAPGAEDEGLVAELNASRTRWQNLEARQSRLIGASDARRQNDIRAALAAGGGDGADGGARSNVVADVYAMGATRPVIVPAQCRAHKPLKGIFKTSAEAYAAGRFYLAAIFQHKDSIDWCTEHGIPIKNQQEIGTPGKGGYLVPSELERAIIDLREQYGVGRRDCRIYGMSAETRDINKVSEGLAAVPVAERNPITEDDKTWGQINLVARKWGVLTRVSSELNEDAIIDMATDLTRDMARAFSYSEDNSLFNGDGTGTYNSITGIKNALLAGATYVATGKTTFSALEPTDFEVMIGMLPNVPGLDPMWYIHKTAYSASMLKILQAAGGNTVTTLEQGAAIQRGEADFVFMGYMGRFLNVGLKVSDQGTGVAGALYFGDLELGVAFGDRRGVTVAFSDQRYFDTDELAIKGTERFDIQVHETGDANDSGTIAMLTFG